jgi:hypothetical protein
MSSKIGWLPRNHETLLNQANVTVKYLTVPVLERVGISGAALSWYNTVFIPKHTVLTAAFEDWRNPGERTAVKITALNDAEKNFTTVYRQLYTGYLKSNPLVTDEDLVSMGLPKRSSGGKTPPTPPTSVIEATADTSKIGIVGISFRDKNEKGTAKPKGVHGAEIAWAILDAPPVDWSSLVHSAFDTRTPVQLVFSGAERGKTLYFALRWENTKGEKGPWSEIYNAIIP